MKFFSIGAWWNKPWINMHISEQMYKTKLKQYMKEFDNAKRYMSKGLLVDYNKNKGYHDWIVKKVELPKNYYCEPGNVVIVIQSPDHSTIRKIMFCGVKKLYVAMHKPSNRGWYDTYMLDEWLPKSKHTISYELMTSEHNCIYLVCQFACLI